MANDLHAKLRSDMGDLLGDLRAVKGRMDKLGESTGKLTGDNRRLHDQLKRTFADAARGATKLDTSLDKVSRSSQRASRGVRGMQRQSSTLSQGAAAARNMAAGIASIGTAATIAAAHLAKLRDTHQRAISVGAESANPFGQLMQIADSKEQAAGLRSLALAIAQRAGISPAAGANLVFQAGSLGILEDVGLLADLAVVDDPTALAEGAGTLMAAFGREETGGTRGVLSKLLTAAAVSKTSASKLAPAATIAAQSSKNFGASDEELLALVSVLSKGNVSAETAATQVDAVVEALALRGASGSIVDAVSQLSFDYRSMTPAQQKEVFGRKEARKGFSLIAANKDEIRTLVEELQRQNHIDAGEINVTSDRVHEVLKFANADPTVSSDLYRRRAETRKQIAELNVAPTEAALAAQRAEVAAANIESGAGTFERIITEDVSDWTADAFHSQKARQAARGEMVTTRHRKLEVDLSPAAVNALTHATQTASEQESY